MKLRLWPEQILGMKLVTPQTGEEGRIVRRLLIEEGLDIKRELYLSILVDRALGAPIFMASAAGGMEIEEVAKDHPEAILRETIRSGDRISALSGAQIGVWAGLAAGMLKCGGAVFSVALSRVHRDGCFAARN